MNIKSKTYMQSSEFKERQGSFAFFRAQAFEFLVAFKDQCMAGWRELFKPVQKVANRTMDLPFDLYVVCSLDERKRA